MRLAFEIILALPFAAAVWTGWRHRRKLKEGKLFTEGNKGNEVPNPIPAGPSSLSSLPSVENPVRLSESEFEQRLIQVEQLRAAGHHEAAERLLATAIGGQMQKSE